MFLKLPIVSVETPKFLRRPEGLPRSCSVNCFASTGTFIPCCSAWAAAWCWRFLTWVWAVVRVCVARVVNQPPHPPPVVACCCCCCWAAGAGAGAGVGVGSSAGESSAVVVAGV